MNLPNNSHLSIYLNQVTEMKIELISEEFLVESVRSLYFHLSSSEFISEDNGIFTLHKNVGTNDHTPQSLQSILIFPFKAAANLYSIKAFVTRVARSSLQSVLQEAIQKHVITPFYQSLEKARTNRLLNFIFKMRPAFLELNSAIELINAKNLIEIAFAKARSGSKPMMSISVMCLNLFAELCKEAIHVHNSTVLKAEGFFIHINEQNLINVVDRPSAVPQEFADDVAKAATALLIRAPPMRIEQPAMQTQNNGVNLPYQMPQNLISFELLLPTEIPIANTPNEEICAFRMAAWSISMPKQSRDNNKAETYNSLDEAVKQILLKPLWPTTKRVQCELVSFILKDQHLLDVIELLASLYFMKRGDIHLNYINGYYEFNQATVLFQQYLQPLPYFEYRFIPPNSIGVIIPSRLRRIITSDQLKMYLKYYQWILKIRQLIYKLATIPFARQYAGLRMQLNQFFISLYQITFTEIETGLYKLMNQFENAKSFDELADAHKNFVEYISLAVLSDQENISSEINSIIDFSFNFCEHAPEMDADEIYQCSQQFTSFKTFLNKLLAIPAQRNPTGIIATFLNSM